MKRWFLVYFLVFSCVLDALPLSNPAEAELFCEGIFFDSFWNCVNFRAGYYGDFVFERNLRVEKHSDFAHNVRKTKVFTNAGYLDLNLFNRLDIFATLGKTEITIETNNLNFLEHVTTVFPSDVILSLTPGFSWSAGARGILYKYNCWVLGLEGQYFTAYPHINKYQDYITARPFYLNGSATYREWQIGAALSYEISSYFPKTIIVPYIGVKWSRATLDSDHFSFLATSVAGAPLLFTFFDCKSRRYWGFPFGVTLLFNRCFDFTLEGRFGDERAFSLIIQGRF